MIRSLILLGLLAIGGCRSTIDPADCDQAAALELVYDQDGLPAFAGQALIVRHCGAGGFCHSEDIPAADRFGAPAGLDYDLRPAAYGFELELDEVARLGRHQSALLDDIHAVWTAVEEGSMPPGGEGGAAYSANVPTRFDRVTDDGFEALPGPASPEGRATLRNWLACGAPVVERTLERFDGLPNAVGFTAPACDRRCVDPSWEAIYGTIIAAPEPDPEGSWQGGSCASARCHSAGEAAGELLLSEGPSRALEALVEVPARGVQCAPTGMPLIVPGDPDASLLWLKVSRASASVCGNRMPSSGSLLSEQQRCALREWIRCGACEDSSDERCASCLESARETCGVDPSAPGGCAEPAECTASLEL